MKRLLYGGTANVVQRHSAPSTLELCAATRTQRPQRLVCTADSDTAPPAPCVPSEAVKARPCVSTYTVPHTGKRLACPRYSAPSSCVPSDTAPHGAPCVLGDIATVFQRRQHPTRALFVCLFFSVYSEDVTTSAFTANGVQRHSASTALPMCAQQHTAAVQGLCVCDRHGTVCVM